MIKKYLIIPALALATMGNAMTEKPGLLQQLKEWLQREPKYVGPAFPEEPQYPKYPLYPAEKEWAAFKRIQKADKPEEYYGYFFEPGRLVEELYSYKYPFRNPNLAERYTPKHMRPYSEDRTPDDEKIESIRANIEALANQSARGYKKRLAKLKQQPLGWQNRSQIEDWETYTAEQQRIKLAARLRSEYLRQHETDFREYLKQYNEIKNAYEQGKRDAEAGYARALRGVHRFAKVPYNPYE